MNKKQEESYDHKNDWEDMWLDNYLAARGVYRVNTRSRQGAGDVCTDAQPEQRDGQTIFGEAAVSRDID
jgi:hypothetical protein